MNKNRYLVALLAVFAMVFTGCSDNEEEAVKKGDTEEIEGFGCKLLNNRDVDRAGGAFYWAVKASEPWTLDAEELADWLTIQPLEGKAGTTAVTLIFNELPDDSERTMELPFVLGGKEVKITVKQTLEGGKEAEGPQCWFTENNVFGKDGGSITCTLQASADWTLSEDVDWLTVSPMEGQAGQTELTLTATPSGGILRIALLSFALDGEIVELVMSQNLNDSKPSLTFSKEAVMTGNQVEMFGRCEFENDELVLEEVGFAYKPEGTGDDKWTNLPSESAITNGTFDFTQAVQLSWGTTYVYKPYAKLNGTVYSGEEVTFTIENRVIDDGVWFYENFDGMYNPDTKVYSEAAIKKIYDFRDLKEFDENGGFLRKNQPNAQYKSVKGDGKTNFFRLNPKSGSNDGRISAQIKPESVTSEWKLPEGTELYPGASGNWKFINYYEAGLSLTITELDFTGAGNLQLTLGCFHKNASGKDELPVGVLSIFVSVDGKQWNELKYSCIPVNTPVGAEKYWRKVVVNGVSDKITALRFVLPQSNVMAIDDIKVTAQP